MEQQAKKSQREHHFYVATAKFLFHHPEYGIVSVQDPIKLIDAKKYDLSPLLLYGLTVPGLPIRWMTYTPLGQPRDLLDVLLEAWGNAGGLRGLPDILLINRHLAQACPKLGQGLAQMGVHVEVASDKEKSLPASLRSAQNASKWLSRWQPRGNDKKVLPLSEAVHDLCRIAQHKHDSFMNDPLSNKHGREKDEIKEWLGLPVQGSIPPCSTKLDWEIGPWLSSWQSSLPPDVPRYFYLAEMFGEHWLRTGEKPDFDVIEEDDEEDIWDDSFYDNAPEIANNLVECWPNSPAEIAKGIGISLREMQWFTKGKASLDQQHRTALEKLLGIRYSGNIGEFEAVGPYVLVARKAKPLEKIFNSISHGGDAYLCEIIPCEGIADPSWRYLWINTYGEESPRSILMAPRGEKITDSLPKLLRYSDISPVIPEFYRDIVSTCARASRTPASNIKEIAAFQKRYSEHWVRCSCWLSE